LAAATAPSVYEIHLKFLLSYVAGPRDAG